MDLISELGSFGDITDIGKCGARLGQCFSSTLPTISVTRNEIEVFVADLIMQKRSNFNY